METYTKKRQHNDNKRENYNPCEHQHFSFKPLGTKIDSSLNLRKNEINLEMIEQFYFRLHPVTYRSWMQK